LFGYIFSKKETSTTLEGVKISTNIGGEIGGGIGKVSGFLIGNIAGLFAAIGKYYTPKTETFFFRDERVIHQYKSYKTGIGKCQIKENSKNELYIELSSDQGVFEVELIVSFIEDSTEFDKFEYKSTDECREAVI
jgi:hypothetical protein